MLGVDFVRKKRTHYSLSQESETTFRVSVVIPTFNRCQDLDRLLRSILIQIKLPEEVTVVDDSSDIRTRDLINRRRTLFSNSNIGLQYLRGGEKRRSISLARNIGASHSVGEIVIFLDDDVVLDRKYVEEILKIYKRCPNVVGVQGYVIDDGISGNATATHLLNSIYKVFQYFHTEKNGCRVLRSGMLTFPSPLTKVINCQWLSGTNSSYRKELLKDFRFDERLVKYSLTEDADLSFRINRQYPDSLCATPYAKFIHRFSPQSRMNRKQRITAGVVYHTYFFSKNMEQSLLNRIAFTQGMLGILIDMFVLVARKRDHPKSIYHLIRAYIYTIKHITDIRRGNLSF